MQTQGKAEKSLTELEGSTLAIIKKDGPCTPYHVRDVFKCSPSDIWSGSAGAVYPLIKRLCKNGILKSKSDSVGKRKRTLLSLTRTGERALKGWLLDIESGAEIGLDPMRSRLHSSTLYTKKELRSYVKKTMQHMMNSIPAPKSKDPRVAEIHQVWLSHRRAAVEEVLEIILR